MKKKNSFFASHSVREIYGVAWSILLVFGALVILFFSLCSSVAHGSIVEMGHPVDFHCDGNHELERQEIDHEKELDRAMEPDCSAEERYDRDRAIEQGARWGLMLKKSSSRTAIDPNPPVEE